MVETEIRDLIKRELPHLIAEDPGIRDFILRTVSEYYTPRDEFSDRFDRILAELQRDREEQRLKWDEQRLEDARKWEEQKLEDARKWEEQKLEDARKWQEQRLEDARKSEEQRLKWEEQNRKWDEQRLEDARKWDEQKLEDARKWQEQRLEDARKSEEQRLKWEEQNRKWDEQRLEDARKWEEQKLEDARKSEEQRLKWEEQNRKWDEQRLEDARKWEEQRLERERDRQEQSLLREDLVKKINQRYDSTIGALGSRWGLYSEASFRNGLQGILSESFGVEVLNLQDKDPEGEVFGRPDQVEIDVIIQNGLVIACEIKSSISKAEMYIFDRKVAFYQKRYQRSVNRKIVISPMVDARALPVAEALGIEVYSYADEVQV